MNRRQIRLLLHSCLAAVAVLSCEWAQAQSARPVHANADEGAVRIRRLTGLGVKCRVKTPEYQVNVARSPKRPLDWEQIVVEYDTTSEWINELTFQYYVLAQGPLHEGKKTYSLYKATVTYIDVERGHGHLSQVYLRPSALKRFGEPIAVAVEINLDGKIVAEQSAQEGNLREKWWKDSAVVESPQVTARDGYLLDRSKTPFAIINVDENEVVK